MIASDTRQENLASRYNTGSDSTQAATPLNDCNTPPVLSEMNTSQFPISPYPAVLSRHDLRRMVRLVRLLHKLSGNTAYQDFLKNLLPDCARFDPGHHSVMMGYDFHLDATGPKLIEVNTNAGGLWYASLCYGPPAVEFEFPESLGRKLLNSFMEDYALFKRNPTARPLTLVILDEQPSQQPLYPEMQVFERLFMKSGLETAIVDPETIQYDDHGLTHEGRRIDMIYNRHCDFYLKTPQTDAIRKAWLNEQLCLSPNPHTYGLLADKRRMILWSQPELMSRLGLSKRELAVLAGMIPETRLLNSLTREEAWSTRKHWVFKPDTGYASRGVYVGEKLTKHKLAELDPDNTLLQQRIPPSVTHGDEGESFKTDYRLFAYQDQILAVSARIYQGQVTNLRTEKGGFAKIRLVA